MTASILAALLVVAPVVPESAKFTIRQNGRTIGTEEFSIRPNGKGFTAEGRTKLDGESTVLVSRMELDENMIPVSYEYTRGNGSIRVEIGNPTSELTISNAGQDSSTDFRFPPGASIVDNNFFHHYLLLLYRFKGTEQSVPVFVPQDIQVGLARIRPTGPSTCTLELGDVKLEATLDGNGRLMRLTVPESKVVVER